MGVFPLARLGLRGYRRGVIGRSAIVVAMVTWLVSCERNGPEAVVTETRGVTARDKAPRLDATSDQRFRDARPSPVRGETPDGWLAVPATQLRLLNYRFGESGLGEVWVTLASGSVVDNVNRWRGQFGQAALDAGEVAGLRKVPVVGTEGVWVEAEGDYAAGMGAGTKPGYGLAGVVADLGGRILTVKMVGPASEVKGQRAALEDFAKGLSMAE